MTDSIARIKGRAAAQARLDLNSQSGKTRKGKLNCTAGNKQCGSRCIPQAWACRLEGTGTNSELKSHAQDPLGGVAAIERGVKTIAKNPTSVQNLERGRNSIIRGIVKVAPGDNLEQKKKLKRNLQMYGNQIGSVLLLGAAVVGAHQSAKRLNKNYAAGLGRDIDMAAFGAVDAVLDRTPFVRDRRSNIRGNAVEVSEGLGRVFAFEARKQASEARALGNSGRIGPLSFPPGGTSFLNTGLVPSTQALQRRVRNGEVGYDQWVKESTGLLYGAQVKGQKEGRSIYSDDAANRLISRQFGLKTPGALQRVGQTVRSQSNRNEEVTGKLRDQLRGWGDTMRADMELKRLPRDARGNFTREAVSKYVDGTVIPNMGLSRGGLSASQQNNARSQARNLAIDILSNGNDVQYKGQATILRRNVVAEYDKYFSEVSDRMGLAGGSKQSTFGDGQVGLARYVMHQQPITAGRVVPVKSRSHANLILRDYFIRKVQNDRGGSFTASADTVQRVAQQINGSRELPDAASAYSIVRESGISSLRSPSEAPSTTKKKTVSKPKKPAKTGLAAQRSQSDLARAIMKRKGFEGSYAEALAQARQEMKRSDAAEDRNDLKKSQGTGKPCGESHIPKSHECSKNSSGRSAGYRAKQVGSAALRTAAIPGGAAIAAYALKNSKELTPVNAAYVAIFGLGVSAGAVQSLRNERRSTKTPEQFASDIRKLSKMPDADPAIVNQVAAFTEEAGIDQQRVGVLADLEGIKGYFDSGKPTRLHANEVSRKGMSDKDYQALGKALQAHNEFRKSLTPYQQDARNVPNTLKYQMEHHGPITKLSQSKDLQNSYGTYIKVHELGHAVHYRGGFKTASSVKVNGKTYAGQDLEKELMKSIGIYGQSDIRRSNATRDDYYSQGNRLETYSENFALYTLSGKRMQKDFPVAYEWTKQTTDNALRQPVKKDPAPFAELIATEGYKGFGTFDPTKDRKDAAASKTSWYSQLRSAASNGDVAKAMKIFTENGKGMSAVQIGVALQWIEAASVTKIAKREMKRSDTAEGRDDAKKSQAAGKPCGESHIPKSYECRKTQNGPASAKEKQGLSKNQKIAAAAGLTLTAGLGIALIAKGKLKPPNSSFKTKLQSRTVAEYVSDSKAINQGLRTGRSELFEDEITVIDDWIKGSQATKGTFFRGINDKKVLDYLSKAKVGDSYTDLGYGSFSKDKEIADEFSRPDQKGNTYMLRVQRASLYRIPVEQFPFRREVDEKEHLAPRNARFRITGKKPLATYPDGSQSLLIDLVYLGTK